MTEQDKTQLTEKTKAFLFQGEVQPVATRETSTLRIDRLTQPKKFKALIPREIRRAVSSVYKTQISEKHYRGVTQLDLFGEVAKWESLGVEYLIKTSDLEKMKHKKPQVYTEAKINIYALTNYVIKQQAENGGRAKATFSLADYLKDTGHTDQEIRLGGRFYNLAKQVLESGAYTNFRRVFRSSDGKRGLEILGSFYTLIKEGEINKKTGEIGGRGVKYKISFNSPYADYIERGLKEGGQFYPIPLKLIADRTARRNPTLFNFIDYLVYITGGRNYPKKIINLLRDIGVKEDELKRQPKCFERLKQCLAYTHENYPELLESIEILNESQEKRLPLSSLTSLRDYTLQEFSDLIKAVGGKDLRECFILFYHGKEKKQLTEGGETPQPKEELYQYADGSRGSGVLGQVLAWVKSWEMENDYKINKTQEEREKFLLDYAKQVSPNSDYSLEKMFKNYTAGGAYPNAFEFLIKVLPAKLKEYKEYKKRWNY